MSRIVPSPAERLQAAADRIRSAKEVRPAGHIVLYNPVMAELLARLLEGMAAHWATRPIAAWNDYTITPLAALERHINGEEKP